MDQLFNLPGKLLAETLNEPAENLLKVIPEILNWGNIHKKPVLNKSIENKTRAGYTALFYGFAKKDKTITAQSIAAKLKTKLYSINLAAVISKYIGETEKNLSKLFDQAEEKNWILFFDEADALFGKRTTIRDSHDRFSEQGINNLWQMIEKYKGLIIISTKQKQNIDDAFTRRIRTIIKFPL